jgi:hypothetical protein
MGEVDAITFGDIFYWTVFDSLRGCLRRCWIVRLLDFSIHCVAVLVLALRLGLV